MYGPWSDELTLQTAPQAPHIVQDVNVKGADKSLRVSWDAPDTQYCQIDFYKLEYQLDDQGMCGGNSENRTETMNTTETSIVIGNLEVYSRYSVTVGAVISPVGGAHNLEGPKITTYVITDEGEPVVGPDNILGMISQEATNEAPGAIEITFGSVPCLQKGGEILNYKVRVIDGDGEVLGNTSTVGATPAIITGLYTCQSVTPQVAACTSAGCGGFANGSTVTMNPAVPYIVQDVKISGADKSLVVSWETPDTQGCQIDFYKLEYQVDNQGLCGENSGSLTETLYKTETNTVIDNLEVYSRYSVTVSAIIGQIGGAHNLEGPGKPTYNITDEGEPLVGPKNILGMISQEATNEAPGAIEINFGSVPCLQKGGEILNYKVRVIDGDGEVLGNTSTIGATPAIITGIYPCQSLTPQVAACTSAGCGEYSNGSTVTMNPAVPDIVQDVKVSGANKSLVVSWEAPDTQDCQIDFYKLEYRLDNQGLCGNNSASVTKTLYTREINTVIGNLEVYSRYSVTVRAVIGPVGGVHNLEGPGRSAYDVTDEGEPLVGPENILGLISEEATNEAPGAIQITFGSVPCLQKRGERLNYKVRVIVEDGQALGKTSTVVATPVIITGVYPCQSVTPQVVACTSAGCGLFANGSTVTMNPAAPGVVSVNAEPVPSTSERLILFWSAPDVVYCPIVEYKIEHRHTLVDQCLLDIGENEVKFVDGAETMTTITGLIPFTTYDVVVSAGVVGRNGSIIFTSGRLDIGYTEQADATAPPNNIIKQNTTNARSLIFSWEEIPCGERKGAIESYNYTLKNDSSVVGQGVVESMSVMIANLIPCTSYTFMVSGRSNVAQGPDSDSIEIRTIAEVPESVANVVLLETSLVWDRPSPLTCDIIQYHIHASLIEKDQCQKADRNLSFTVPEAEVELSRLEPYSTYHVTISAETDAGVGSQTTQKFITPEQAPTRGPKEVNVTAVSATGASFAWSEIECGYRTGPIIGYKYSVQIADGQEDIITDFVTTELECVVSNIKPFTRYMFNVKGYNHVGDGGSKQLQITTDESIPTVPRKIKIHNTDTESFQIEWSRPQPPNGIVTRYQIDHTVVDGLENMPKSLQYIVTDEERDKLEFSYTVENLQPNANYSVQVAAFTAVGIGPWSGEIRVFTKPGHVHNVSVLYAQERAVMLSWKIPLNPNGAITKYYIQYRLLEKQFEPDAEIQLNWFPPIELDGGVELWLLSSLEPATKYEIKVFAKTSAGEGEPRNITQITLTPPVKNHPKMSIVSKTDTTVTVNLKPIPDFIYVRNYVILVEKNTGAKRRDVVDRQYASYLDSPDKYITASFPRDSVPVEFTVGDGNTYGGYHNAPLVKDTIYNLAFVVDNGELQTEGLHPETVKVGEEEISVGLLVGLLFVLLLAIIVLVLVITLKRRRRIRSNPMYPMVPITKG